MSAAPESTPTPPAVTPESVRSQSEADELRDTVGAHLKVQGFVVDGGRIMVPVRDDKVALRDLHLAAIVDQRRKAEKALRRHEDTFVSRLATGDDINPHTVRPRLVPVVHRTPETLLWRWCALHWSIPVSTGYGRRLRYLIVDDAAEQKVIGVIGLGDPVFGLKARDQWIGWDAERRKSTLTSVMDAFALGAVEPYSRLLGGKLAALLAASTQVRTDFHARYGHKQTLIAERDPDARLAVVTTSSALGRSSVYNRLRRPDGTLAWEPIGYTAGSGDFHLTGDIYDRLADYARRNHTGSSHRHENWTGSGFRNRREAVTKALDLLGFDGRLLRTHGVQRQVFAACLMHNTSEYLKGDHSRPRWRTLSLSATAEWWRDRWAIPRSERTDDWTDFDPESWRIWPDGHDSPWLNGPEGCQSPSVPSARCPAS